MIVVTMSPIPGMSPINASKPKRMLVPGTTRAVSSSVASASTRAMRASRDAKPSMSNVKPAARAVGLRAKQETGPEEQEAARVAATWKPADGTSVPVPTDRRGDQSLLGGDLAVDAPVCGGRG